MVIVTVIVIVIVSDLFRLAAPLFDHRREDAAHALHLGQEVVAAVLTRLNKGCTV
jgi:hypothetical protein